MSISLPKNIIKVPVELKAMFLKDPENFIRDIACVSTESTRPFFRRVDKIIGLTKNGFPNPFNDRTLEFDDDWKLEDGDTYKRYMHIDLGLTKDAVGISMCHAPYFVERELTDLSKDGIFTQAVKLPYVKFDFLGRIKTTRGEEIMLSRIREIIYDISKRGFYIGLITYDGFQSTDSIQILRSQRYKISRLSIDRTATKIILDKGAKDGSGVTRKSTDGQILAAVQSIKDVLYDDRLEAPVHPYWEIEARGAEIDYKKNKVDHKPRGSIDLFQSMAGSTYNLINNEREYTDDDEETIAAMSDDFYDDKEFDDSAYYEQHHGTEEPRERPETPW